MKRIIIFSDTHHDIKRCIKILDNIPCDLVLHLGDCVSDVLELQKIYKDIEFKYVSGNNDYFSSVPKELVVEFENIKLFLTHGHIYNNNSLLYKAEETGSKYALIGHSHVSEIKGLNGIKLFNPGSISRPRDGYFSYGVIEIENDKVAECIIKEEF